MHSLEDIVQNTLVSPLTHNYIREYLKEDDIKKFKNEVLSLVFDDDVSRRMQFDKEFTQDILIYIDGITKYLDCLLNFKHNQFSNNDNSFDAYLNLENILESLQAKSYDMEYAMDSLKVSIHNFIALNNFIHKKSDECIKSLLKALEINKNVNSEYNDALLKLSLIKYVSYSRKFSPDNFEKEFKNNPELKKNYSFALGAAQENNLLEIAYAMNPRSVVLRNSYGIYLYSNHDDLISLNKAKELFYQNYKEDKQKALIVAPLMLAKTIAKILDNDLQKENKESLKIEFTKIVDSLPGILSFGNYNESYKKEKRLEIEKLKKKEYYYKAITKYKYFIDANKEIVNDDFKKLSNKKF